ncbi:MAG: PAS domain S-box protein [Solirubrobacterales bacterium]
MNRGFLRKVIDNLGHGYARFGVHPADDKSPAAIRWLDANAAFWSFCGTALPSGQVNAAEQLDRLLKPNYTWWAFYTDCRTRQEIRIERFITEARRWIAVRGYSEREGDLTVLLQDITNERHLQPDFLSFADVALDLMCIVGLDGYFRWVTPSWERVLGWFPEELMVKPFLEFVHPDDRAATRAVVDTLRQGRNVMNFNNRYQSRSGAYVTLAWNSFIRMDTGMIYAVARDVSDQRAAAEALQENEANFHEFFDAMDDFVMVTSQSGTVLAVNRLVQEQLGGSAGGSLYDYFDPADRELLAVLLLKAWEGNSDEPKAVQVHGPLGRFDAEIRAERGHWSHSDALFVVCKDTTELLQARDWFAKVFRDNPAFISMSRIDTGEFVDVNESFLEALGRPREEVVGHTAKAIAFYHDDRDRLKMIAMLQRDHKVRDMEVAFQHKNGEIRIGLVSADLIVMGKETLMLASGNDITELKRREAAILEAEIRYRSLFEQSPDGILMIDPDTLEIVEFNDIAPRQLGYTAEEFKDVKIWDFEAIKSQPDLKAILQEILKGGRRDFETRHRTKDGEIRNVYLTVQPITLRGRKLLHTILRDVTAMKKIERALREERNLLGTIMESIPDMLALKDTEGVYLEANTAFCRFLGRKRDEVVGKVAADVYPLEEASEYAEADRFVVSAGEPVMQDRFVTGAQTSLWVHATRSPVRDTKGRISGILLSYHDIDARKKAEQALVESEAVFRQVAENIDEAVWLRNDHEYLYVSPRYGKIWQRSAESLMENSDSFLESVYAEDYELVAAALRDGGCSATGRFNQEYRIVRPNGDVRWVWVRSFPVFQAETGDHRRAGIALDITDRKQAELERAQFTEQLRIRSITDGLTGLFNHQHILGLVEYEIKRARRHDSPLAVLMMDIDHFKQVNDTWGHQAGDQVLIGVANRIKSQLRGTDLLGRYGGEEFLAVLPETSLADAVQVAERVREAVQAASFGEGTIRVTISIGAAVLQDEAEGMLIARADDLLYQAKQSGRNRTEYRLSADPPQDNL